MSKLRWKWIGYFLVCTTTMALLVVLLFISFSSIPLTSLILFQVSLACIPLTLFLSTFFGYFLTKNIRKRLEEVSFAAKNLAYGNLTHRLPFTDDREIGEIALSFNEMADRIEQQVRELQRLAAENEALINQAKAAAVTEERQRLARDLHDAVSQQLFAISMTSATLNRLITKEPQKAISLVTNIEESARKAQAEMRALLLQLRPVTLEKEDFHTAIINLGKELMGKQIIDCEIDIQENLQLSMHIENQLYRILQEGFSNILRHAQATKLKLTIRKNSDQTAVHCKLEDNGIGFSIDDANSKTSYGMKSIRERIAQLGGTVNWLSYPDKGTVLDVMIPITKQRGSEVN